MIKLATWLGKNEAMTLGKTIYLNAKLEPTWTSRYKAEVINHESIHLPQYKECTWVGFWLIYVINFILLLPFAFFIMAGGSSVYREVLFEKEAYTHEKDLTYLQRRKPYAWLRKIKNQ